MSFLNKEKNKKNDASNPVSNEELAQKIYDRLKEHSELPVIKFTLKKEKAGILESKIGGAFYVPTGLEAPKDEKTGKELFLLAQLNFSELPKIEDFPENGLLQFFIAGDDDDYTYGCDFDNFGNQASWRIRYIENLPEQADIKEENIFEPEWDDDTAMPFDADTEYSLIGEKTTQPVSEGDYRFDDFWAKYCADLATSFAALDTKVRDILYDKLSPFDSQMGGYPYFTQYDPRYGYSPEEDIPEILLFQLDSVEDIMWGDSGIANFFIRKKDLQNKDFSKVWYNWDCC